MKIFIVPKWIMPFGYGLTIYKIVFVRKDSKNIAYVIAHEAEHVKQWVDSGAFKFPFLYRLEMLKESIKSHKIAYKKALIIQSKIKYKILAKIIFPFLYVKELLYIGYKNNKYEVQARKNGAKNEDKYKKYM